jgi:hypothetical protein
MMLEKSQEMVETFGGFREVAGMVPREAADIAVDDGVIQVAESLSMPVQPPAKRFASAHVALDTARGIPVLVEAGREVVQLRPQRTAPQSGNHVRPCKDVFEHVSLLFPNG